MLTRKSALFKAIGLLSLFPCISHASSFQILEQSPALMGQGFAGTASTAEDATTVFFNPAALNQLDRSASVGINGIFTESKFRDTNSNTGGIPDKTDEVGVVPNLYAVFPYREGITFGFGVN
jgi:long-chain fatty acid transport protein